MTTQIIMVSYYRPRDMIASVDSIIRYTDDYHLTIIDNSSGHLKELDKYRGRDNITIYENNINLGKGRAIMQRYNDIMSEDRNDYFVSIDGDICVSDRWLQRLKAACSKISDCAIMAPIIMNMPGQYFNYQMEHGFIMHNTSNMRHEIDEIYYNRYTAGPLFYINKIFFESVNGYSQDQLYGNDDGELCKAAHMLGKFIGLASNVHVIHSNLDDTVGYRQWKHQNVANKDKIAGYWD